MVDDPRYATGKTKPAQLMPAPMVEAKLSGSASAGPQPEPQSPQPGPSAASSIGRGTIPQPATAPSPPADGGPSPPVAPASAPAIDTSVTQPFLPAPPTEAAPAIEQNIRSDEERTLLALLRLIDRLAGPGTLSPVERAFVAGAKIMFDQLSKECREMLKRKPADLTRSMAPPGMTPHSVGNVPLPEAIPEKGETASATKRAKKAEPSKGSRT
jgi:hypothetical protein